MTASLLVLHPAGLDTRCAEFLELPDVLVPDLVPADPAAAGGLDLRAVAAWVAAGLDGPTHVVGLSMGGMIAQWLAIDHPERVRSLALACTTSRPDPVVMRERAELTLTAPREEIVRDSETRWFSETGLARDEAPVAYARDRLRTIPREVLAAQWTAISGHHSDARLPEIGMPTTCLAGSDDVSTPVAELSHLRERLPHARLVTIPGPHYAFLEDPGSFAAAVRDHLHWAEESGA